jgi:hypothetical protein
MGILAREEHADDDETQGNQPADVPAGNSEDHPEQPPRW